MVTENGMIMMTLGEYHSLNVTKNKVEEIEKSNEMLRKAMIHLTGRGIQLILKFLVQISLKCMRWQ